MGAEKKLEPGHHDADNTHIVQATDKLDRAVCRDPFKSLEEAEARAAELRAEGHSVEISALEPAPKG